MLFKFMKGAISMALSDMISQMFSGTLVSLNLFFTTIILSMPLGFLLMLLYISKNKIIKNITGFYILMMRGTPLLLQLFFMLYGVPILIPILTFSRFTTSVIVFALNYAAYFAEIFRGGLLSVDKGQFEASKVLGISKVHTYIKIVIPQMIKVALPSISNEAITLIKDTALVTAIGIAELLFVTKSIVNTTAQVFPFVIASAFYLFMCYILTIIFRKLEVKFMFE